jgi:hypothetical protein
VMKPLGTHEHDGRRLVSLQPGDRMCDVLMLVAALSGSYRTRP